MKIHTNVLTARTIFASVPEGCYLAYFTTLDGRETNLDQVGSRSHDRAYVVRLSGTSKNAMRGLPDHAATWDEWGIFIAELFKLDPDAKIGQYKTHDDFLAYTADMYNRASLYRPDLGICAPWLSHN